MLFFPQNTRNGLNHHKNSEFINKCGYWHFCHFRAFGDGDCKGITVGDCQLKEEFVIETIVLPISAELCQELCYESSNCAVFQHSAENCTLLREDYRQDCETAGGPSVSSKLFHLLWDVILGWYYDILDRKFIMIFEWKKKLFWTDKKDKRQFTK